MWSPLLRRLIFRLIFRIIVKDGQEEIEIVTPAQPTGKENDDLPPDDTLTQNIKA